MGFASKLKELRTERGLTQKQLAEKIVTTDDCIYFWEKNRSEPSINELIALANFFDVTIDELVDRKDY